MQGDTPASQSSSGIVSRALQLWREAAFVERGCLISLLLWLAVYLFAPEHFLQWVLRLAAILFAGWTFMRWSRVALKDALWRLRNRLVVAYLFMAAVPVILILLLSMVSTNILAEHLAVYLANLELERHAETLRNGANAVMRFPAGQRVEPARRLSASLADQHPGLELTLRGSDSFHHPETAEGEPPPAGWRDISGVLVRDKRLYLWARVTREDGDVTITEPITRGFLSSLAPQLGGLRIADLSGQLEEKGIEARLHEPLEGEETHANTAVNRGPGHFFMDQDIQWWMTIPLAIWEKPMRTENIGLSVSTRMSWLINLILTRKGEFQDITQTITFAFYALVALLVLVELAALFIGISISRSMTNAVHELYEGTLRVQQGDFSHRIQVKGKDQVAGLSDSFNAMTAKIEQLLVVAKEKERLQTELAIAREVQAQLFPKEIPGIAGFQITAACDAARSVSGDYYDFRQLSDERVAVVMGDVSGKGISAALLMATLASSLRTQLGHCLESANGEVSTSGQVSQLNKHLYAHTSPEKYATFCMGVYDAATSVLTYTNAGHLPPILIRKGAATMFDVNGIVVGAFPLARYEESHLRLEADDLLLFYTDGITEPENEYGEMFGEERLIELLIRHADCPNEQIIQKILDAVRQWTYDKDSMDDMTLLLARRS